MAIKAVLTDRHTRFDSYRRIELALRRPWSIEIHASLQFWLEKAEHFKSHLKRIRNLSFEQFIAASTWYVEISIVVSRCVFENFDYKFWETKKGWEKNVDEKGGINKWKEEREWR